MSLFQLWSFAKFCALMKADLHYLKSGACRPRRRASLTHCALDPVSDMVIVRRSLRHDKAADTGASWGAQSSTSFLLKRLCGYKAGSLTRDAWQDSVSKPALRCALDTLLVSFVELFTLLGLVINWNPCKTEIGSVAECERSQSEHGLGIPIQGTDSRSHVVHSYKHLGGVLQRIFPTLCLWTGARRVQ